MLLHRSFWVFSVVVILCLSCKKQINNAGSGVLGSQNILNGITVDTFDLITYTVQEDSIITDNAANIVLGSYTDPKLGSFDASFYTQLLLGGTTPNFGDASTIVLDSFVLALEYTGYYGALTAQNFEVYEMDESIYLDSAYYIYSSKLVKPTNHVVPSMSSIIPDPNNNVIVGADTLSPQLRIHLDTNLARTFITEAVSGSSTFSSNEDFKSYFKGLYVKTNNGALSSGDGAALYINLNDASSKVTMYFQQDGESKTYDLVMSSDGADFVHIDIDYSGFPVDQVIQDSSLGKVEFYAQAFTHRAAIKIPGLDSLPPSSIIHSANLELPVQFQSGTSYAPGTLTSVATRVKSTDEFYTPLSSIGQYIDYKKQVEVDLRYYVQSLLTGEIDNTEVVVSPLYFINSADRIVFNGQNTTNKNKPRLILTYTTY